MKNYVAGGCTPPAGVIDREGVRRIQRQLNANGAHLSVDGVWGPKTDAAYQTQNSSSEDELADFMNRMQTLEQPATLSYTPQTAAALKAQLESALRPALDTAIANRKEITKEESAALDADAWSRGMGRSTYVTDAKSRQQQDEADDISRMESDYTATLAQRLMDAVNAEQDRALSVAQYNAEQQNAANKLAFSVAQDTYADYAAQQSGSAKKSTGSSGGKSAASTTPENCRKFLASLTPQERKNIYNGVTEDDRQYRDELIASLGKAGYLAIQQEYPPG